MEPEPLVSIVIPTKDAGPAFAQTLAAIAGQAGGCSREIIVIDSGSQDGTPALARLYGARTMAIAPGAYQHGATRNRAIAQARGRYVVLLVQDAVPADERWLAALVEALESEPQAAGAYSRQVARPDADYLSRHLTGLWQRRTPQRWLQGIDDPVAFRALPAQEQRARCTFDNVSSIVRRAVWQEQPFPEVAYAEDVAWAQRVLEAGYRIVYEPASLVVHSHERPACYELRRSFVEWRTMGALFPWPSEPLTIAEAQVLLAICERECAPASTSDDADLAQEVQRYLEGEEWFRAHFAASTLRRIFGPQSPWPPEHRRYVLERLEGWEKPSGRRGRLLGTRLVWRPARLYRRVARPRLAECVEQALAGADLDRRHLDRLFAGLWTGLGRDAICQAVWDSFAERPLPPVERAELEMRSFAKEVLDGAQAEAALSAALYRRVRQVAAAWIVGRRLGLASLAGRGEAEERFWRELAERWAGGI